MSLYPKSWRAMDREKDGRKSTGLGGIRVLRIYKFHMRM